jgi:calcineurin-like phosphoesterase family protein
MSTFFTADLHFNHAGIMRHCKRRFRDVKHMNRSMIEAWNNTVTKESDIVWVLGDFGFKAPTGDDLEEIFWKLRGIKRFVVGNHDEKNPQVMKKLPWDNRETLTNGGTRLPHIVTFRDGQRRAELCHYPLETWKNAQRGTLMLHGHSHGSLKRVIPHRFDMGIDVWHKPMDFEDIWEIAQGQSEYQAQDHHADTEKVEPWR